MILKQCALGFMMVILLAACALGDAPGTTTAPPVTLNAPPTLVFAGDCEGTEELNMWLQSMDFLVPEFLNTVNSMANLTREAMRERVIHLAGIRDQASEVATPDCAQHVQLLLTEAMNTAVTNFQAYANGDLQDLGNIVAEIIGQIDRVIAAQNDLITQLEEKFQQQRTG
jgi:hypothetical protein